MVLRNRAGHIHILNNDKTISEQLGALYDGPDTKINSIIELRNWYRLVNEKCSFTTKQDRTPLALLLKSILPESALYIRSMRANGVYDTISNILNTLSAIKIHIDLDKIPNKDLLEPQGSPYIKILTSAVNSALISLDVHFSSQTINYGDLKSILKQLIDINSDIKNLYEKNINSTLNKYNLTVGIGIKVSHNEVDKLHSIYNQSVIAREIQINKIKEFIYQNNDSVKISSIADISNEMDTAFDDFNNALQNFLNKGCILNGKWCPDWETDIRNIYNRNKIALINNDKLIHWVDYINTQSRLETRGLSSLVECIVYGKLDISHILDALYFIIYDKLSRELYKNNEKLNSYFTRDLATLRTLFQNCDCALKSLQRKQIASNLTKNHIPQGTTGRHAKDYTELRLLERECAKQRRHIPIRKLIQRASGAILGLKPCFMMGPLAVAQYLPPGLIQFDLVIMDEASQIKPEDAIGVIARGKQSVIIGDPKQLPPTNFFSNMMEETDDEDEKAILTENESILDAAIPIFNKRRLRWHYRSQHESLIAFSNSNFYNSDLIIFPSPHHNSDYYGIKVNYIKKARFADHVNQEEAQAIVDAAINHLLNNPDESLGIVAMNLHQADLIDSLIEEARKKDPLVEHAYETRAAENEPVFIKNLENVQGDERDVILISTTYGPSEYEGKVHQRFGPINSDSGWRRLNVLFTRSKKRMHIFTSLRPEDIIVSNTSSRGVKSLRDFLSYAHTGILDQAVSTGKSPDSDFEVAVGNELRDAGFDVEYQVGVAGFFIDIAVKDPTKSGFYLMGIECDGAAYHSAKSARDNDRLRQEILETKGWKIRRIWSTDWFKDYKSTIKPIINELKKLTGR